MKSKVLFLSVYDYAGSGHRYSEAVNRHGKYASSSLKFASHKYGYKADYCIGKRSADGSLDRLKYAQQLVDEADILHFKGDYPVEEIWGARIGKRIADPDFCLNIPLDKPIVITTSGSNFRRHLKDKNLSKGLWSIEDMKRYTNARTVTTPDLNYPEFESTWMPFPIDSAKHKNEWIKRDHDVIRIAHSPSDRRKKGTDKILVPAFKIVQKLSSKVGRKVVLDIIEGVSYKECLLRKRGATIFWDQFGFGFYGNALVEASQWGIPSMAWISPHSITNMSKQDANELMAINFPNTPNGCANAIMKIIGSDMRDLSIRTKEWANKTHSYEAVGKKLSDIYDGIL